MKFKQISKTFSDETAHFAVSDYKATTIGEFVDEVLKENPKEWGKIEVVGGYECEYRYGELLSELPEMIMGWHISEIKGYGGWGMMNYIIYWK